MRDVRGRPRTGWLLALVAAALLIGPGVASATYPGLNGQIPFESFAGQTSTGGQLAAMIVPNTGVVLAPLIYPGGGLRVQSRATPTGKGTLPQSLAFSADDRLLATGNGGTVSLFRLTTRNPPLAMTAR